MKNVVIRRWTIFLVIVILSMIGMCSFAFPKDVNVTLPSFEITLNGSPIDNWHCQYPLIVYNGITYFPLTYRGSRYLGLETKWDPSTGLEVLNTNISHPLPENKTVYANSVGHCASIPQFDIRINGKSVDNTSTDYPLLVFRDVTYLPLTWEYVVQEFGWQYRFDSESGLVINSRNASPKLLKLRDYLVKDGICGQFIVSGDTVYYEGNQGIIYKADLNDLSRNEVIYQLPKDSDSGENVHVTPYFIICDGRIVFSYTTAETGRLTYEIEIKPDGTTVELGVRSPSIAPEVSDEGILLYKTPNRNFETEKFRYMITSNINKLNDSERIYKLDNITGKIALVSEKPVSNAKYRNKKLYFVSGDTMLYSLSLHDDQVNLECNAPIYQGMYEVVGESLFYLNGLDNLVYKVGDKSPVNPDEKGEEIRLTDRYIIVTYRTSLDNNYKTEVYSENGDRVYFVPRKIGLVSTSLNNMLYFDEVDRNIYLVKVR